MMRVLNTIHLSDFQKKVLAITKAAPTPQVAFEELRNQPQDEQRNIVGARDILQKLGLLEVTDSTIEVTEKGEQVMADEYLIDETGELTAEAQKYLGGASGNQAAQQQQPEMGGEQDMEGGEDLDLDADMDLESPEKNPFESLDLLCDIHHRSKFLKG
jgi:hypothetical protein